MIQKITKNPFAVNVTISYIKKIEREVSEPCAETSPILSSSASQSSVSNPSPSLSTESTSPPEENDKCSSSNTLSLASSKRGTHRKRNVRFGGLSCLNKKIKSCNKHPNRNKDMHEINSKLKQDNDDFVNY